MELWGNLSCKMSTNCVSSTQSLTLIPYEFSYLYWQSPITVSGMVIYCIMSLISSKGTKKILSLIPEVMSLVKIILVMPATNAIPECAFSALRRVKFHFCTTMSNYCLNHLMICTVHKEMVMELNYYCYVEK